jgi:hypothetical protein
MRKAFSTAVIAVLTVMVVFGCTKGYETRKTAGDLTVLLSAGSYPLVKGNNNFTVKLSDATGKAVTDAKVDIRYYMPPMPGMAPMEYQTQATPAGDAYKFTANIPMEGGWRVDVTTNRGGSVLPAVTFNVDAR